MKTSNAVPARPGRSRPGRWLPGVAVLVALGLAPLRADSGAPLCSNATYQTWWCEKPCPVWPDPNNQGCSMKQGFWCANDEPYLGYGPGCTYEGCPLGYMCSGASSSGRSPCTDPKGSNTEICGDSYDNDGNGCAEGGCAKGKGACTCTKFCASNGCGNIADCDPRTRAPEICNGRDDNCDGRVDEGCNPKQSCPAKAGADPIILSNQSAVTEPFTDFAVEAVSRLSITRTWNSMDGSFFGDPAGIFGRGWHHDWEGRLTCTDGVCVVSRGLSTGLQFQAVPGTVTSLDGTEAWQLYRPTALPEVPADHHDLLVRRPNGEWILFRSDGTELRFSVVCDACGAPDVFCVDPLQGGVARLTSVTDQRGNVVQLTYARGSGVLLGLTDALGHSLEVRAATACGAAASELRYDGSAVATYSYSGEDLQRAADADGSTLRSYTYDAGGTGLLRAVLDESGTPVAEFSYDATGRAIGVVDRASSVAISYAADGWASVTEFVGTTSFTSLRRLDLNGDVVSISDGCACGPARTLTWKQGNVVCEQDALGHSTYRDRDQAGRVTHEMQYAGTCPPTLQPSPVREKWFDQGLSKTIAQGVTLDLDRVRSESRVSTVRMSPTSYAAESFDYSPAAQTFDPAGYVCQESPLPAGAVACREISSGWVPTSSGPAFERHATFYSYDSRGRLVRKVGPVNLDRPSPSDVTPVEERTYWADGESLVRRGRLRELKRYPAPAAPPLVTAFDYDAFGVFQITAPDGGVTTSIHDGRGRVRWSVAPDGARTEVRYHEGLDPRLVIAPSGVVTRFTYDGRGRPALVEHLSSDPDVPGVGPILGWSEATQYDAAGNPIHVERRDGQGNVTWTRDRSFDVLHRPVGEPHPELPNRSRSWSYDPAGGLTSTRDEEGRTTSFTLDSLQRVNVVTRTGLQTGWLQAAIYTFEQRSDSLTKVQSGSGIATTYKYDDFGRLRSLGNPTLKTTPVLFTYDARGNTLSRNDGYAAVTYAYDGLDRVVSQSATNSVDGASISYAYQHDENGSAGRLTSVTEPERTVRYSYDLAGRIARERIEEVGVAAALETSYAYDPDGALSSLVYPSGLRVELVRDAATREVRAVVNAATGLQLAANVARLPGGPVQALTFGNGLTLSQAFNRRYEPLTVSSGPVALGYGMTAAGNVSSITAGSATRTFQYDYLDELTGSTGWLAYAYDSAGNRTSDTADGTSYFHYYTGDRVTQSQSNSPGVKPLVYGYDRQSNLSAIAQKPSGAAVCLRHDPLGRLVLVGTTASSGVTADGLACLTDASVTQAVARFKYDARARRVARWLASTNEWTYVVSDASGNPLSELALTTDPANPWRKVRDYVWLDGRPIAQIEYPGPGGGEGGYVNYVHVDHIGLPRALTNSARQIVWSAVTRPYGDLVETATPDPLSGRTIVTNLRLPGQYDERLFAAAGISGMQGPYYNWNRWYLPSVGRYLELDPVALEGGFNGVGWHAPDWYNYGGGNPLLNVDPSGLDAAPCLPGDSTVVCCLKKFPACPECCGATGPEPSRPPVIPWPPPWWPWRDPKPNDCSPKGGTCNCTCLGTADPTWNPTDPSHGDRNVGQQSNKADCRAECTFRGFKNSQCM